MNLPPPLSIYSLSVALCLTGLSYAAPGSIIDGDFEAANGGAAWETNGGAGFVHNFPTTGGNPGGYAELDGSASSNPWGILVSDNGNIISLASLGLEAGQSYLFTQDMKKFSGSEIGGLKVDFFVDGNDAVNGSTENMYPTLIGTGSTWETYEFEISIPEGKTGLKLVPLWGQGSSVGIDNLVFDTTPIVVEPEDPITSIPNGDFEMGGNAWSLFSSQATEGINDTTASYESTGGNPGGHALMTNNGEGWGVIVSNNSITIPVDGLGLTAGETYTFQQDMKLFSGSDLGKLKVEFYDASGALGNTGDITVQPRGDSSTWQTYEFQVSIPEGTESIKVVPVAGIGSSVGYDNVGFQSNLIIAPPVLNANFEQGGANWGFFADGPAPNSEPTFPSTGGNPGGFGQIKNFNSFAGLVSNGGVAIPISKFGFTGEGEDAQFMMDMKIIEGQNLGGFKLEFLANGEVSGSTEDLFPAIIGDGSTWETYTFDVFIPFGTEGIKVIPLWGENSTVGYDNIITPQGFPSGFDGWIAQFPNVGGLNRFNDDPDNDGQPNGLENFLGTDPSVSSSGLALTVAGSAANPLYSITHSQNAEPLENISSPVYEWSTDLVNYYQNEEVGPNGTIVFFEPETNTPSVGTTTVDISVGGATPPKFFVRVVISENDPQ